WIRCLWNKCDQRIGLYEYFSGTLFFTWKCPAGSQSNASCYLCTGSWALDEDTDTVYCITVVWYLRHADQHNDRFFSHLFDHDGNDVQESRIRQKLFDS